MVAVFSNEILPSLSWILSSSPSSFRLSSTKVQQPLSAGRSSMKNRIVDVSCSSSSSPAFTKTTARATTDGVGRRVWLEDSIRRSASTILVGIGATSSLQRPAFAESAALFPTSVIAEDTTVVATTTTPSSVDDAVVSSSTLPPSQEATTTTMSPPRRGIIEPSTALCDPTVSVWRNTASGRVIVLLGTAHISQLSAELAGTLVQQVRPNAVFVELDIKRVARIATTGSSSSGKEAITPAQSGTNPPSSSSMQVVIPNPRMLLPTTPEMSTESATLAQPSPAPAPSGGGNWFTRGAMNLASNVVGNAVKGMYSSLSEQGFQPGEEFATAIRAGQEIDAAIVLGDQDVQVTLRRLTQALAVTDLDQLLNPNSSLEQSMAELLPPIPSSVKSKLDGSTDQTAVVPFKEELTAYVERLKSRDQVRKLMAELNNVAPALIQVMLTERDAYMAAGLDTLNQFNSIVAVMGIAHQDGVERNLKQRGWTPLPLQCGTNFVPKK